MTDTTPDLSQFGIERASNGIVHLVFDCPGRTMNVFSEDAIRDLGLFAEWLHTADVRGVVVRSGKPTGFCAGADLSELGAAYDMIMAARPADRFDLAYNHFFRLSHALRRLETAGTPIAVAIGGVALGGGCELTLGCHYRALGDSPRAMLGLPECQVGLLPGAGGTQRITRLIGVTNGLEVLLRGRTYSGQEALTAGLVHAVVPAGEEVAAAEAWLLSADAAATQPWDRVEAPRAVHADYAQILEVYRDQELGRMLGHEPAPIAIVDCVELGLMQPIDGAIRSEMSVFAHLIQRSEPRNMIRSMFLGKQAYDKAARGDAVPASVTAAAQDIGQLVDEAVDETPLLSGALFGSAMSAKVVPVQERVGPGLWLASQPGGRAALTRLVARAASLVEQMDEDELLQLDHLVTREFGVPAYIGGVSGLARM